jgi:hypothetical protein
LIIITAQAAAGLANGSVWTSSRPRVVAAAAAAANLCAIQFPLSARAKAGLFASPILTNQMGRIDGDFENEQSETAPGTGILGPETKG